MQQNNLWEWDKTKIILKDPKGNEVVLSSLNLNDLTCELLFQDIEEYVKTKNGELK